MSYMAAMKLRGWFPRSIVDFLLATTLGRATSWVITEAAARQTAGVAAPRCRWKWLPFPRRVCPPSPPPPPPPPPPLEQTGEWLELLAYCVGASPLLLVLLLNLDRGQYGSRG